MDVPPGPGRPAADLTNGELSLLRATQLIFVAAGRAEARATAGIFDETLIARAVEGDVKAVLWKALSLLPDGLPLDLAQSDRDLRANLELAAAELRSRPLGDYPSGTAVVLTELISLLAWLHTASGPATT